MVSWMVIRHQLDLVILDIILSKTWLRYLIAPDYALAHSFIGFYLDLILSVDGLNTPIPIIDALYIISENLQAYYPRNRNLK